MFITTLIALWMGTGLIALGVWYVYAVAALFIKTKGDKTLITRYNELVDSWSKNQGTQSTSDAIVNIAANWIMWPKTLANISVMHNQMLNEALKADED